MKSSSKLIEHITFLQSVHTQLIEQITYYCLFAHFKIIQVTFHSSRLFKYIYTIFDTSSLSNFRVFSTQHRARGITLFNTSRPLLTLYWINFQAAVSFIGEHQGFPLLSDVTTWLLCIFNDQVSHKHRNIFTLCTQITNEISDISQ